MPPETQLWISIAAIAVAITGISIAIKSNRSALRFLSIIAVVISICTIPIVEKGDGLFARIFYSKTERDARVAAAKLAWKMYGWEHRYRITCPSDPVTLSWNDVDKSMWHNFWSKTEKLPRFPGTDCYIYKG